MSSSHLALFPKIFPSRLFLGKMGVSAPSLIILSPMVRSILPRETRPIATSNRYNIRKKIIMSLFTALTTSLSRSFTALSLRSAPRFAPLLLVLFCLLSAPAAHAQNLVTNGDFETPNLGGGSTTYFAGHSFGGWVVDSGTVDFGALWQAASGSQSVDMDGIGGSAGTIYQDIPTSASTPYQLTFALAGNFGSGPLVKTIEVFWGTTSLGTFTFDITGKSFSNMGWQDVTIPVPANLTTGATRLKFVSRTGSGWGPAIDNVKVSVTTTPNLITNGDFEQGNIGFVSQYSFGSVGSASAYTITTNPNIAAGWASYRDHTSGSGNMMLVNGGSNAPFWSQTVAVARNTNYSFSTWIANATFAPLGHVALYVNGVQVASGTTVNQSGLWTQVKGIWNSGNATSTVLSLVDLETAFGGNDFSVDDINFSAIESETPETVITDGPVSGATIADATPTFAFTGFDSQTATANLLYRYRVDGGAWSAPNAGTNVTLGTLTPGAHTFEVSAVDEAGNVDPTPATANFIVDLTPPAFSVGPTVTNVKYNSAQINWTTDDAVPGTVEVALNDGTPFTPILTYDDTRKQQGHAYIVGPLKPNTAYLARVVAGDAAGNKTVSTPINFTTPPLRDLSLDSDDIDYSDSGPSSGQSITMSVKVKNTGDVNLTGTLVFFDYSPIAGTKEISRHPIIVNANSANPPVVTSAPFVVGEGAHQPYAQLINISPTDDIPANNATGRNLFVGAPARRLEITLSDQNTFPGDDRLITILVRNTGSKSFPLVTPEVTGVGYIAPDAPSDPILAPGDVAQLSFRLNTPLSEPGGTPPNPIKKPVTITLAEFVAKFDLNVYSNAVGTIDVTILDDATGLPINGALVATDGSNKLYVTRADGKLLDSGTGQAAMIPAFPGTAILYGYAKNYIAKSVATAVVSGQQSVTLRLTPGQTLELTKITTRKLTRTEIQQRGVNLSDPNNYFVYDFVLYMRIGAVSIPNVIVPIGGVATGGGTFVIPGGGGGGIGGTVNIQWEFDPTTQTETWIVIPGDVRILKQFWDATVFVRNNSDTLTVNNVAASLTIPDGLALPDLNGPAQSVTQTLGAIAPLTGKQASWVVRGDKGGKFRLTGQATGDVVLGGTTVPLVSTLQSDELEVIIPKIRIEFLTPLKVRTGDIFTVGFQVFNESPINLEGVTINIKAAKLVNCHLPLDEPANQYIGSIPIGEFRQKDFRFVSEVTGDVLEVRSYVSPLPVEPDITVTPIVNRSPDAVDDSSTIAKDTATVLSVLANDTDPEGDFLTITGVTAPARGTATVSADKRTVTYKPSSGYLGPDSFTYTITDGNGNNDMATVNLQVTDPNAGPAKIAFSNATVTRANGVLTAIVTLSNTGGNAASNIAVTSSQLGSTNTTTSPLPTVANLAPGANATVTLTYPSSAGVAGQSLFLKVNGKLTGGTFTTSRRVTLP